MLLLVVGALVTPLGMKAVDRIFPPTGRLQTIDLVVENAFSHNEEPKAAVLDIKVQNKGDARLVATQVVLTLQRFVRIGVCDTQGEVPVTGTYAVSVPPVMRVGDALHETLNQQVGPDEVDRFQVQLQNPPQNAVTSISLYAFRVSIENNGDPEVVDAGTAILALPLLPDNDDAAWYWGSKWVEEPLDWLRERQEEVEGCLRTNSQVLRDFLGRSGTRSDELAALASDVH